MKKWGKVEWRDTGLKRPETVGSIPPAPSIFHEAAIDNGK